MLDDCLAAVDSHVARHVFGVLIQPPSCGDLLTVADNVIGPHGLLATKARVLVTNSIAFVKQFDSLVYLRRGIILESGSYQELIANTESEISRLMYVPISCSLSLRRINELVFTQSGSWHI